MRVVPSLVLAAALAAVLLVATDAPGSRAESARVKDHDSYESYFLGAKSAKFKNGKKRVVVRVKHHVLRWNTVDLVRFTMLTGRLRTDNPPYATKYTAIWELRRGVRLERQTPGQEFPARVRCRGVKLRHSEQPARLSFTVPTRCLKVPSPERPHLAKGGGNDLRFSYLVHNVGGNVTETVPGKQNQGPFPGRFTRWVDRG